ncbi:NAD(P)-binding protein [Zopfia rhizophila CBS 207.26]|uniref:NAD(P)-binding protein n=1 Tax=Zopfia rhizophila CBS 207.26 TaxID=1314779 RepID=A0A6A6DCA0_9PEZI|nr:NAD(P)-binding protein [Zopfia rhizophila CBS 207.26]
MGLETTTQGPPIKITSDKFSDHVVLVSGAAQGIGLTTAQLFASQSATVVMVDIQEDKLKTAVSAIRDMGGASVYRVCNITDEEAIAATFQWVISVYSEIDVLAHIAGVYPSHPLVGFPTDHYRKTMSVNVDATFFVLRAVLLHMESRGYGRIILTSSSTIQEPEEGLSAYIASKSAVIGFTRAAATEAAQGITVNTVMPGLIRTGTIWETTMQPDGSHPLFDHVLAKQIVKRYRSPEDIGYAVCFLASPEASFVTGQILDLSGGAMFH